MRIGVFGSIARDEASTKSDIDIIVEFDPLGQTDLFTFSALAEMLKTTLGKEVDLVTSRSISKQRRLKDRIEKEVLYV